MCGAHQQLQLSTARATEANVVFFFWNIFGCRWLTNSLRNKPPSLPNRGHVGGARQNNSCSQVTLRKKKTVSPEEAANWVKRPAVAHFNIKSIKGLRE